MIVLYEFHKLIFRFGRNVCGRSLKCLDEVWTMAFLVTKLHAIDRCKYL